MVLNIIFKLTLLMGAGTSYSSIDNITTPVAITVPYFSSILLTASGQTSIDIEAYINNGGATITAGEYTIKKQVIQPILMLV